MLKKDTLLSWTPECQAAFDGLKQAMIKGSILEIADLTRNFEVEVDASDLALGRVLLQNDHQPITCEGRKLNIAEKRYTVPKRKCLSWFIV